MLLPGALLGIGVLVHPGPSDPQEVLDRFQARLRTLHDLRARFTQRFHSETLGDATEEEGVLYVKLPGRMRWEYTRPGGKLAVLDGERTFLYLPEEERVIAGRFEDLLEESPAALLLVGELRLLDEFLVERAAEPGESGHGRERLRLVPRRPNARFDSLLVELERGGTRLRAVEMVDPLGNRVEYRFDQIREDLSLPDELFRFRPPEDAEWEWVEGS